MSEPRHDEDCTLRPDHSGMCGSPHGYVVAPTPQPAPEPRSIEDIIDANERAAMLPMVAPEPTCCELACYEDPGCTCEGCVAPEPPAAADEALRERVERDARLNDALDLREALREARRPEAASRSRCGVGGAGRGPAPSPCRPRRRRQGACEP